jgi:hypothetical protein
LGSFGAWKPRGRFPGAGVETTSWDLGFLLLYAPLSMAPASNSSPTPGPTLAAGEMVYGTADAVMRFQRAGRGDLSRLLQTNISRNSASAQSDISDTLRTLHTLRHSNPALGLAP